MNMNDTPTAPLFPKGRGRREKSEHPTGKVAKWWEIRVKPSHSSGENRCGEKWRPRKKKSSFI